MKKQEFRVDSPGTYEYILPFDTDNEEGDLLGVIEARTPGEYDIKVMVSHKAIGTRARVAIRGVVENGARVKLVGLVKIGKRAKDTDSFLGLKLLMLDNKSYALAEPELEILNNEVKASHLASVGRINKEQLFYLASRGIGEMEAKELIVEGFLMNIN